MAENMHRHYCGDPPTGLPVDGPASAWRDYVAKALPHCDRIDTKPILISIHEVWHRSAIRNGISRRNEGQARHDHLIASLNSGERQGDMQSRRAVDDGDDGCSAAQPRELLLELVNKRSC
jgi:hypothetical protein